MTDLLSDVSPQVSGRGAMMDAPEPPMRKRRSAPDLPDAAAGDAADTMSQAAFQQQGGM